MTRAIIVDDHPLMCDGLARLVRDELGWSVAGTAAHRRSALELVRREQPDVIVLDLQLPDGHGLDLLKDLRAECPALRIAIITASHDPAYGPRALAAGAHAYMRKDAPSAQLLDALRGCVGPIESKPSSRGGGEATGALVTDSPPQLLSERELSVFQLIGLGRATREIAAALGISFKTVEAHRENIKRKLGLANSVALAQSAALWVNRPPTRTE